MKETDGILTLLADIKDLLFGTFLLILGGFLLLFSLLLSGWWQLLGLAGLAVAAVGLFRAVSAYQRHQVVKKEED